MHRTSLWLLWLVALFIASPALAAPRLARPDTVRLRFDWRPGMTAWVDYEALRTRVGGDRDLRTQVSWRWRLSVSAHPKGLAVRTDSIQLAGSRTDAPVELIAQRLAVMTPVHVVSNGGEFIGLQDAAAHRAGMAALMDSLLAATPGAPPGARETFQGIYTDAFVEATAADSWNSMVGTWLLGELELGEPYVAEITAPSPIAPQLQIPLALEFAVVKRVPCGASNRPDCVEITMSSRPDSVRLREVMARFFESQGVTDPKLRAAIEGTRSETELTAVTRPDGLRPERVVVRKRVSAVGEEAGRRVSLVQEDVKTYRFRWVE